MPGIRFHGSIVNLLIPAQNIYPDPRNPNNGDVDEITTSILQNGCYRPIYVNKNTRRIVAGHNLYEALLSLGAQEVPVSWVDGDDEDAVRILVADNAIARRGRVDDGLLLTLLEDIVETDAGLRGTGITERGLDQLRELAMPPSPPSLPDIEPLEDSPSEHECPSCGYKWNGKARP